VRYDATSKGGCIVKVLAEEVAEAKERRKQKRRRDREFWDRHRARLNKKRRAKYAAERKLLAEEEGE
jgi:hypothetical protein